MPFDPPPNLRLASPQRPVALWLFALCFMVLVMVTLGGATRLTGSGLSIMEWAPIMGTLPPMSDAEWNRLYALYQHIPQYDLVNHGFGLAGFKGIFWLEYVHRLWGRLMGAALIAPLAWFAWRGQISRKLGLRLLGLLILGGLQGGVGWFMVASGFEADRTTVSPYRLVLHLALAVSLYAALLWTALGVWRQANAPVSFTASPGLRRLVGTTCAMLGLTILAGGFVAGLHAGLTYNTFPLMDGHLIPPGYAALSPLPRNWFENVAAVQFDHRLLASLTLLLALATTVVGLRAAQAPGASRGPRHALHALGTVILLQYALGVATLLWAVPLDLATTHQAMAMLALTAALVTLHQLRAANAANRAFLPHLQSVN